MGLIKEIEESEYADAMETVWKVFLKFNAPDYNMEGIDNFRDFLVDEQLYKMFLNRQYRIFAFYENDRIEGVASVRNENHISLLFVSSDYQKRGVGTALLNYVRLFCNEYEGRDSMTVNAAPYAVDFYRKYGFSDTGEAKETDGIIYTPMKINIG